ncbi:hypothetical protein ANCDUO_05364 [Ancylostoma duodenale]|uniref:Uncharacterized protein n=1 Tax=Ancylostoma duodenale TaxID=51022 RepID=A0A0C2GSS5_9BILA|nr:hypothetical protein ANCDUO_05364 [Ancylostoma duodenale]
MNGLNIGLELQKIRGGSMINEINMHMNLKIACMSAKADDPKCRWANGNKYYIYSALNYHPGNMTIYPITTLIDDCNGKTYCGLDVFAKFAYMAKPDQSMGQAA